jgi:hypothetical protein
MISDYYLPVSALVICDYYLHFSALLISDNYLPVSVLVISDYCLHHLSSSDLWLLPTCLSQL